MSSRDMKMFAQDWVDLMRVVELLMATKTPLPAVKDALDRLRAREAECRTAIAQETPNG
jgi:hypothetical protein